MTTETTSHVSSRMHTRLVNAAADVISRAMQQGRTLPAALAVALDSAQLLQSPETVAELEAQRERHRARLVAAEADLLNVRGLLSPTGQPRRVPAEVEIHERVAPAVEWLLNRVAELEGDTEQSAPQAPQGQQARTILDRARDALDARMTKDDLRHVLSNVIAYTAELEARIAEYERPADGITRRIAPVQALREDSQGGAC
ncbi:hypothetical protein [Streptomyces thermodiastaticus]|uniref:hypothetical protein n=1 Tax=Streptomyces thermodiastaticus TaxID=44061 RepID=UPI0016776D5A|nr:hypothetical protein [Streptomyces thermodiastaticus]MCE7550872.1 hypothetical protein [Streptomyces thermodiastaticus]GHF74166.1 hypothetical protein GCM10018787_23610 [Streptomyces thermodiastaticus]